jgi:hypothetical protein
MFSRPDSSNNSLETPPKVLLALRAQHQSSAQDERCPMRGEADLRIEPLCRFYVLPSGTTLLGIGPILLLEAGGEGLSLPVLGLSI